MVTTNVPPRQAFGVTRGVLLSFFLIVENFGVRSMGERHAHNLPDALKEHYNITESWKGYLYAVVNLNLDYFKFTFQLTMDNCIAKILFKFSHPDPNNPYHSPYNHTPIQYVTKVQYTKEIPNSPHLNNAGFFRVQ